MRGRQIVIKFVSLLLLISMPFIYIPPVLAAIGDQPATEWCLQGDIQSEKELEGQLFTILSLGTAGTAVSAPGVAVPFGVISATSYALGKVADPKNAIWENWPSDRFVFHHVPPEKFISPNLAEKALYSTIEFMANIIFSATKSLVRISNNIIVLAFHTSIISGMAGWVSDGIAEVFTPTGSLTKLIIVIGLILLLIYCAFKFLRGQAMSVLNATVIACIAVGGVFFFTANAQYIITKTAEATDSLAGVFLSAVGGYTFAGLNIDVDSHVDRGLVGAGQTAWQVIVTNPWALGQFGSFDENKLKLTQDEYDILDKKSFPQESQGKIQVGMRLDTLMLGSGPEGRDAVAEALGRPNKKYLWIFDGKDIDHGEHDGTMNGFAPNSAATHFKIACLTMIPAIGYTLLAVMVGLSIVLSQIILVALIFMLPLPLFAAMIPDTGWAFAAKYGRAAMGFFVVKLVYGLYLSLVLAVGTGIANAILENNVGIAMLLLGALFTVAALGRKKFLSFTLESIQKGATSYNEKLSDTTKRLITNNKIMTRKLAITDILTDWRFSGRNAPGGPKKTKGESRESRVNKGEAINRDVFTSANTPGNRGRNDNVKGDFEGQPPDGYPFKELSPPQTGNDLTSRREKGPAPPGNGPPTPGNATKPSAVSDGKGAGTGTPVAGRVASAADSAKAAPAAGAAAAGKTAATGAATAGATAAAATVAAGQVIVERAKKHIQGEIKSAALPAAEQNNSMPPQGPSPFAKSSIEKKQPVGQEKPPTVGLLDTAPAVPRKRQD